MAPNIGPPSIDIVENPDNEDRIRCAILGCGMVRVINSAIIRQGF